jgi:glycosyltransferase involved in cell wall biosynthesis
MYPRISIITINRNNALGLRKTIESVLFQNYGHIEYIIIDGNSTDTSVDEIKAVESRVFYWISEPDTGLYNAMNKGLKKATGDYVLFLNSADYFYNDQVIQGLLTGLSGEDIIYGNLCTLKAGIIKELKSAPIISFHKAYQHTLPPHPVVLIKRRLINEVGGFDERFKIIADVVLIAKLFSSKDTTYKFVDIPVTVFDTNGVSSNPENQEHIYQERRKFILNEFPQYLDDFEKVYQKPGLIQRIFRKVKQHL